MTLKKLLVLDVNGLLVDTYFYKEPLPEESPDARVGNFYVYKRPFCEEFLQFCLDNFTVGVWSSAREYNVNNLVDYVFGGTKEKLAFSWHQSDCTDLGLKSPDNQFKPLFLKELSKLWSRVKVDLPWSEGNYGPSNTLLVDDTPYKAILNPPNTAIFPRSYNARDLGDNFLGGALRSYLEGIRDAVSVQTYVESNPFGEPSITPASPLWSYVNEVVLKVKNVLNKVGDGVAQIMRVEAVSDEGNEKDKPEKWQNGQWKHHSDPLRPVEVVSDEGNKEDKSKRGSSRKQKYHSDPSKIANSHLQSSDFDFPSEVVELQSIEPQSSDCMLQQLGNGVQVHDSSAQLVHEIANLGSQEIVGMPLDQTDWVSSHVNQPFKDQEMPSQVGKGISFPSRPEEPSKDEHQDKNSLFTELGNCDGDGEELCENSGFILSLEQGHHGTHEARKQAASMQGDLEGIVKEHEEENQGYNEGTFHIRDSGIDAELDRLHEQHYDDEDGNIHGEGNESFEKSRIPVGDDGLKSSKSYRTQVENNIKELSCGRREMRNNNFVRASDINYASQHHSTYSNPRWHKHRGTSNSQRNDTNRGSLRYGQGRKSERRYHQDGRTQMPYYKDLDKRGHYFTNNQHMKYVDRHYSGNGYRNRIKPSFGHARYSEQRWIDRPVDAPAQRAWGASIPDTSSWDHSQQDCGQFSNSKALTNAGSGVFDSKFSTQPFSGQSNVAGRFRKFDEYGREQDGGPSSYSWHQGFEQGAVCGRSNVWPERTEQLNVNGHISDSNLAIQAKARGNGKRQRLDFASKEAGALSQPHRNSGAYGPSRQPHEIVEASSQLYRNTGAFNQPYRGQHGASRQPYQNVEASHRPYHNMYNQGLPPGGFSRSRQSQEVRNL